MPLERCAVSRRHSVLSPQSSVLVSAFLLLLSLLAVTPVAADDERAVGPYRITASFATTPVYPEEPNALLIRVVADSGAPVVGLERTLRLRIGVPHQATETWELTPEPGQPGVYRVNLLLPRAGTYTMDLFGTLDGREVFERFITGQNGLDQVIVHGRQYPRGAGFVVLLTFGFYLVGLAYLLGRNALSRWKRQPAAGSRQ